MVRRTLLFALVFVLATIGLITPASAKTSRVNATQYTAQCSEVNGQVNWSPPLYEVTGQGPITVMPRQTLTDCTATPTQGGSPVTITEGVVSGEITSASPCTDSAFPVATLKIRWITSPKLSSGETILHGTAIYYYGAYRYPPSNDYIQVGPENGASPQGPPGGTTGSFSGTDNGFNTELMMDLGSPSSLGDPFNYCGLPYKGRGDLKHSPVATVPGDASEASLS
jgi:hypothetical protein